MAPQTMKAAVCKAAGAHIVIEDVPIPTPTGRYMLVRVKAASLCQSDIGIISGDIPALYPRIIGHEAVSVVEELGPDAGTYGIQVGDLIGAPLYSDACLSCTLCKQHGSNFCNEVKMKGLNEDGYFAEYTLVDAAFAVVIGKAGDVDVPAERLAPLFCAGLTVWDAIERCKPSIDQTVAVVGVGGLGALACRFLDGMGVKVLSLDVRDEQLDVLRKDGVVHGGINTRGMSDADVVAEICKINNGKQVDIAIATSGVVAAYGTAMAIVGPNGKIGMVGVPHGAIPVQPWIVLRSALQLIGARVAGQRGAQRCIDFTLRKGIYPKVNPRKFQLEEINEMVDLMKANRIEEGRMVVTFS